MEPKTISLRIAMQLESNGYPQNNTYWYWVFKLEWGDWRLKSWEDLFTLDLQDAQLFAAPTGDELDEDMPIGFVATKMEDGMCKGWYYNYEFPETFRQSWEAKTIRDVKGKAWGWLNDNSLLKYPRQSKPFALISDIEEAEKNGLYDFAITRAEEIRIIK